jgi:lipoate-protein ligase A
MSVDPQRESSPDAPNTGASARRVGFAEEVHFQEALLRRGAPAVRVGVVRERVVSFGIGVVPDAPYLLRARTKGVPTVPRTTGGTGVLHLENDIVWAVVLPRSDPRVGRDFARAYGRLGRGVVTGLAALGIRASWVGAPGLVDDYCPLSARGEVLATEAKVLGAAAQHVTSSALLHHGSVSWEVDRGEVDDLFALPPGGPSTKLGGVAELGVPGGPAALAEALAQALSKELGG